MGDSPQNISTGHGPVKIERIRRRGLAQDCRWIVPARACKPLPGRLILGASAKAGRLRRFPRISGGGSNSWREQILRKICIFLALKHPALNSSPQTLCSFGRGVLWIGWFNSDIESVTGQERSKFPRIEDLQFQALLELSDSRSLRQKQSGRGSFPCLDLSSWNEDRSTRRFQVPAPVSLGILCLVCVLTRV